MRRTAPSRGSRTRAARAPHARALRAARCPERNPIIDSWRCYNTVICYNNQGDVIKLLKLLQLSGRCRVAAVRRRGRCAGSGRRGERRGRRPNERRGRAAISNNATAEGMPSLRELIGNLRDENTASISKRWELPMTKDMRRVHVTCERSSCACRYRFRTSSNSRQCKILICNPRHRYLMTDPSTMHKSWLQALDS